MHSELALVFDYLSEFDIAICGSAVKDYEVAQDIDVMVRASANIRHLCAELGIKYRGCWQQTPEIAVRRSHHFLIPGVSKAVHLCQNSQIEDFADHPFAVLVKGEGSKGAIFNAGKFFDMERDGVPSGGAAVKPMSARQAARLYP